MNIFILIAIYLFMSIVTGFAYRNINARLYKEVDLVECAAYGLLWWVYIPLTLVVKCIMVRQ